jgi:hypothetical protein
MKREIGQLCECAQDGICRGSDVDPGTAAAFREQWLREAEPIVRDPSDPIDLILRPDHQPGDIVVMTAAVHSLHRGYPGKYRTAVESRFPEVFTYNPDVVPAISIPGATVMCMHYPAVHQCNDRGIHFMQGWTEFLGMALGISVPLLTNRPHLYFPDDSPPVEDFWVICSGGKRDLTNKLWGQHNYQEIVDQLRGVVRFVQVGEMEYDHPRLRGVEYMVGKTTLRGLFGIVRRARGVLCGVSLPMHVAAALERPAIVVAGGREPVQWNAYPRQQYVHTVGALPCRSTQGHVGHACWRSRVVPLGDGTWYDRDTCEQPVGGLPLCMRLITPTSVAELVMRYNQLRATVTEGTRGQQT